jgi:hypothetical protein
MTISYPRSFPTAGFQTPCSFELMRNEAVNRVGSNQVQSMELYDPYWSAKFTTHPLYKADRSLWRAWVLSLKGSTKTFYAYDPDTEYPIAYPLTAAGDSTLPALRYGGSAFDGTCTLVSNAAGTLTLSGLPVSYVFTPGDHVSIGMSGGQRSLHVVTEALTGSSTGTATIAVEPPVRSGADTGVAVQLVRATCIMVLVPGTFSAPSGVLAPVSFEAMQTVS